MSDAYGNKAFFCWFAAMIAFIVVLTVFGNYAFANFIIGSLFIGWQIGNAITRLIKLYALRRVVKGETP